MPSPSSSSLTSSILQLITTGWINTPNVSSDDQMQRSLLVIQLAKTVLGKGGNSLLLLSPSQAGLLVKHLPFLVSKCFVHPPSASAASSLLPQSNSNANQQDQQGHQQQTESSSPSSTTITIDDGDYNGTCESYRNLVKSLFILAIRRSLSFKVLQPVDVRKSIVELLLACQIFEPSNESHHHQPQQALGASIAVTGLKLVRLVVTSVPSSDQLEPQPQHKTSGLPSNLISALTNSLKQVPQKLKILTEARKHRKRGFFEGKDEQERNLQLVSSLRASILNLLQILFEDGVSPAATYATPVVRELGYKRRDFEVSSVAAFVTFSSEPSAIENNLRGIATPILTQRNVVNTQKQLTKTTLKNSYINGESRNALLDDDITMQLALLELVYRRISQMQTPNFINEEEHFRSDDEKTNQNNQRQNEYQLLTTILIPLLNCSPDVMVSASACCLLSHAIILFHKSEQRRLFKPESENDATPQFVVSSLNSIRDTLRSISLRATGSLELDSVSQSLAALSKITSSNNNGSFSFSPKNKLNEILLGSSSMSTSTTNNRLISQSAYFENTATTRKKHGAASIININSPSYSLRVRRLGFILSARLFELLSMNKLLQLRQEEECDDEIQLQDEKDQQMTEFLEWMSQCGLKLDITGSDDGKNTNNIAVDALYSALRFVKDEIEFDYDNNNNNLHQKRSSSLHRMDDFRQLCCDFQLRLM